LSVISLTSGAEKEVVSASYKPNVLRLSNSTPDAGLAPKNPKRVWVAAAVVVVLLFGFGAARWLASWLRPAPAGDATVATLPAATEPPPSPALVPVEASGRAGQAVREVEIQIKAHPKHARIFFDDSALATNPATRRVRESAEVHKVRAEAKGYGSQEIEVTAEKDVVVAVKLDRVRVIPRHDEKPPNRAPKNPPTAAAPPTSPPPPPSTRDDPSARNRIQKLDKSNPWED
jgi:hypothetical protein